MTTDNEKIRFVFYKAQKGDWFGWLISAWTGIFNPGTKPYCHVEIGFLIDGKWKYYSSASRNTSGTTGTRWLDESILLAHRERWDIYDVSLLRSQSEMIKTCADELGKEYDWLGIFGFVTLFGLLNAKSHWYCSEICHYVFFGQWERRVSPRRLYSQIKEYII